MVYRLYRGSSMVRACKAIIKSLVSRFDPMLSCQLEIGLASKLIVRTEYLSPHPDTAYLYISDIHLTPRRLTALQAQLRDVVREADPDLILLGGDIVDSVSGLKVLPQLLASLGSARIPVAVVPGNHDWDAGVDTVAHCVRHAGMHWLPDRALLLQTPNGRTVEIAGSCEAAPLSPRATLRILCAHEPQVYSDPRSRAFHLVLAGHYHGGQIVLFRKNSYEYPNGWFYPWSGPRFVDGGSTLIVSRGVSDTLPFRFNCQREVILCRL